MEAKTLIRLADAQFDLLAGLTGHFVGFVMLRLKIVIF